MTIEEARASPNLYVIMGSMDRAQCYLTAPMRIVQCGHSGLGQLLQDLDSIFYNEKEGAEMTYETHKPGDLIEGGRDGGLIQEGLWVHKDIVELDLESKVRNVLEGRAARIVPQEDIAGLYSRFTELLKDRKPGT